MGYFMALCVCRVRATVAGMGRPSHGMDCCQIGRTKLHTTAQYSPYWMHCRCGELVRRSADAMRRRRGEGRGEPSGRESVEERGEKGEVRVSEVRRGEQSVDGRRERFNHGPPPQENDRDKLRKPTGKKQPPQHTFMFSL